MAMHRIAGPAETDIVQDRTVACRSHKLDDHEHHHFGIVEPAFITERGLIDIVKFTSKGIQKTSISDIVEDAGVAKGTFYLYFKDKYDIRNKAAFDIFRNGLT